MLDKIPQRDTEIIDQLAFSYAESVQEATRNTLATIYKKGVIAERKAVIDKVLEIIDAEAWSYCDWLIKERAGIGQEKVSTFADNLRERIKELKGGESLQNAQQLKGETW